MPNPKMKDKNLIRDLSMALQSAFGRKPTEVSGIENISSAYYFQYLLRLTKGIFDIKVPKHWDSDFLLDTLLLNGCFGIFERDSEPIAMNCQPYGVNMYYKPTSFNIANPVLGTFNKTIGEDGELIYLEEDPSTSGQFRTIRPLLNLYSYKLAACDKCLDQSLMNSGVAAIFSASSAKAAQSYREMYDDIQEGKPAVFVDTDLGLSAGTSRNLLYTPAKDNFICDKVQIEKRCIIEEFLTAIGVNNANIDKRERLNSAEVNSNNDELRVATEVWRRNLRETTALSKELFPSIADEFSLTIKEMSIIDNSTPSGDRRLPESGNDDTGGDEE